MNRYADILLPLAQPLYTFALSAEVQPALGSAVAVQFGARSVYTGIVWRLHDEPPVRGRVKSVLRVVYDRPILHPVQMRFWEWIADYYMCTLGEVMRMALPAEIKPHSANADEFVAYTPRCEKVLALDEAALDADVLSRMQRRAPKRYALVAALQQAGGVVLRREAKADAAVIRHLADEGIISVVEREIVPESVADTVALPTLSPAQSQTLEQIRSAFDERDTVLLHGVTSSGKTEIYMHLIAQTLAAGRDILYLVPEISATSQLVERLRRAFGGRVIPCHSRLTPARRTGAYMRLLHSEGGNLVVGTRSAVFMPFEHLGLVVVDEEHDGGYKQSEPAPRYNGRDAAVMLAAMLGAKSLLGSATPSIESYANSLSGKYARITLDERYGGTLPPKIIISDTLRAVKRGERKYRFNKILLDKIAERLSRGEQVMLFQNRLGYSSFVECSECGWTARCPHCNVSLAEHRSLHTLRCRYCGYSMPLPERCPACSGRVESMGFGTERVENDISELFPQASVLRLDGDTLVSDAACNRILSAFARHEADILVGTQIIAKGLDFDNVTLVGILNADNLLNTSDFRAGERAWQLIMQVAGRCGRRNTEGEVVVQTAEPSHPVFGWIADGRYDAMASALLAERQMFSYPPYTRLLRIIVRGASTDALAVTVGALGERLRNRFGSRVFGPVAPIIDKVRGEYLMEILLKIEVSASFARARSIVRDEIAEVRHLRESRNITIICDVDVQ